MRQQLDGTRATRTGSICPGVTMSTFWKSWTTSLAYCCVCSRPGTTSACHYRTDWASASRPVKSRTPRAAHRLGLPSPLSGWPAPPATILGRCASIDPGVEQFLDLGRMQPSPGQLVSADLRERPSQRRGDGISALALAFPDLAQLRGKAAAPRRRAATLALVGGLMDIAVVTCEIAAAVRLEHKLAERNGRPADARPASGRRGA
jgi:hypothetical protein